MFEAVLGHRSAPRRNAHLRLVRVRILFRGLSRRLATRVALRSLIPLSPRESRLIESPCSGPFPTAVIENLRPLVDGGRYPIKRVVGEDLVVEADIFKDGHDIVAAAVEMARRRRDATGTKRPMTHVDNDRWRGVCTLYENATYEYTVEAWTDIFRGWQHEFAAKFKAGIANLTSETLEGAALLDAAAERATMRPMRSGCVSSRSRCGPARTREINEHRAFRRARSADGDISRIAPARRNMRPPPRVIVDRIERGPRPGMNFSRARPRAAATAARRFAIALPRVDDAKAMGFDVIYFPPIHPIGHTNRKGRNNSVTCEPGEPGVPYAIGIEQRTAAGTRRSSLRSARWRISTGWQAKSGHAGWRSRSISRSIVRPIIPTSREHPEWFYKRPDGTIKYAENPPKKYEDIYPLNFRCENWRELWEEMKSIILFWAERGVRIFRVDNPHTKPVAFWEYLISGVRDEISGRHFSLGGVHPAENDEGAGQGRLHAELHLFHLAQRPSRS